MSEFDVNVEALCNELASLLEKKNRDYGDSFAKSYDKYGDVMPLIRMEDKLNRLSTIILKEVTNVDESVRDTLIDLAGYAILTILTRENNERPSEQRRQEVGI